MQTQRLKQKMGLSMEHSSPRLIVKSMLTDAVAAVTVGARSEDTGLKTADAGPVAIRNTVADADNIRIMIIALLAAQGKTGITSPDAT